MNMKTLKLELRNNLIAMLFASGIAMTVLSCFSMYSAIGLSLIAIVLMFALLILFRINFVTKIVGAALIAFLTVVMLVTGVLGTFVHSSIEMFKTLAYFILGSNNIFLVYSDTFAIFIAFLSVLLAKILCDEYLSFVPMIVVLVALMYVVLQIGVGFQYIYTLPSWIALMLKALNKDRAFDIKSNAVALAIVALAFVIIPFSMGTIKPLNNFANELKQKIKDYMFFNDEREIFSINDYGYYPFGVDRFGGKPEIKDDPILTVQTDKKLYLRGATKDFYTGLAFTNSKSTSRFLLNSYRWRGLKKQYLLEEYPITMVNEGIFKADSHKVDIYNSIHSTLLIPAYNRELSTNRDMVPYFNEIGEQFITRNLAPGDSYTFSSPAIAAGDVGLEPLVDRASGLVDKNYRAIQSDYLQVPDHIENAVYNLKDKIIANAETPYDKAMAIMNFLQHNYNYSLDVKEVPSQNDFITYFLFIERKGYCTYFASAMTMLCRMSGVPARYVEGFVANPDSDNLARVTGKDAHAWTEVYLSGFGWVPFDATAPIPENKPDTPPENKNDPENNEDEDMDNEEEPTPTPPPSELEPSPEPSPEPDQHDQANNDENHSSPILFIIALIAIIIATALYIYYTQPPQFAEREKDQKERIRIYVRAVMSMLNHWSKDVPKYNQSKTLFDYCISVQNKLKTPTLPFANSVNTLIYSNKSDLEMEEKTITEFYNQLYSQLSPWKKPLQIFRFTALTHSKHNII